jgi:hypothetical protein
MPDGSVFLRDPGLYPPVDEDPERQALQFLRGLPLSRETRPMVARATRLEDVGKSLSILLDVRQAAPESGRGPAGRFARPWGLRPLLLAASGLVAVVAISVAATILAGGGTGEQASLDTPNPPGTAPPTQLAACPEIQLPASVAEAQAACGRLGEVFSHDASCARGTACTRRNDSGTPVIGWNAYTLAYVGGKGDLYVGPESGADPVRLTSRGGVENPVWSPDGRYLAYLRVTSLSPDGDDPPRLSTQLHVIEVERPANDGIVLALNNGVTQPEWSRSTLLAPHWSADGRRIFFLRGSPQAPGGDLYTVDLPFAGEGIDFSRMRAGALPEETIFTQRVSSLQLTPGDFGVEGYFSDLFVAPDDSLFLQVCQDGEQGARCVLGRWDGTATLLAPPEDGVAYSVPAGADAADVFYGSVARGPQDWRLVRIPATGGPIEELPVVLAPGPQRFTLLGDGKSIAIETAEGTLVRVQLADGVTTPLWEGGAPTGFLNRPLAAGLAPAPPSVPFNTPTPVPTPSPTPTATPAPQQPMSILISVRRGSGYVPAATVTALTGGKECARGQTDASGRVNLLFPSQSSPPECRTPGAEIHLEVNGVPVTGFSTYSPGGTTTREIEIP